jgi:CxxC motif-containing protein (DUF1111 family)
MHVGRARVFPVKTLRFFVAIALISAIIVSPASRADPLIQEGGELTSDLPRDVLLELPAPPIRSGDDFSLHLEGHQLFHKSFLSVRTNGKRILGPHFNNDSCGSCHVRVGRGPLRIGDSAAGSAVLIKIGLRKRRSKQSPPAVPGFGEQLQDRSLSGRARFRIKLRWKHAQKMYPDGSRYSLRRPVVSFSVAGYRAHELVSSIRMTPPLIGMGLLDSIPSERILSLADPDDRDGDGISGKAQHVPNRETGTFELGRFGFRASHPTLKQQTAAALFNDMGISTEIFKAANRPPELPTPDLLKLVFYQQLSGVPRQTTPEDPSVIAGEGIFTTIGCQRCHTPTQYTGENSSPNQLSSQIFKPFTDLLLHDMGPGLADSRAEFRATGREWRTSPLWGLGLSEVISPGNTGFLHDGRARTIEEAILWHGGEAAPSRDTFMKLPLQERLQLIQFLRSL